jgi:homogentisate phytyltransferase/homogentisate geranylgeranyltransferase
MYSLKPFRLKRYPVFAAFCIVAVRGAIINASFFAHAMAAVFQQPSATVLSCLKNDPRCLFSSIFFGIFGIVIAFMKDVPDVLGDKSSNVRTFSVRIGPERMFHMSRKLLMGLFYVCTAGFLQRAIVTASTSTPVLTMCRYMVAVACLVAAQSVRQQSKVVDPSNPSQVYQYYMHLWKIFYISYLMLPFAR